MSTDEQLREVALNAALSLTNTYSPMGKETQKTASAIIEDADKIYKWLSEGETSQTPKISNNKSLNN